MVASAIAQITAAAARYTATSTTLLAKAAIAKWCQEVKSEKLETHRDLGQTHTNARTARPQTTQPATTAAVERSLASCSLVARDANSLSAKWRNTSRHARYPGSTASEFRDQKPLSASRKSVLPPNQPRATRNASTRMGEIPLSGDANLLEILLIQAETNRGASPSPSAGIARKNNQVNASFGRLISESTLPASDTSVRLLVLDASSSTSPWRGSANSFTALSVRSIYATNDWIARELSRTSALR